MDEHDGQDREGEDTRAVRGTLTFAALMVAVFVAPALMARRYPKLLDLAANPQGDKARAALEAYRALVSFTAVCAIAVMGEAHGRTPIAAHAPAPRGLTVRETDYGCLTGPECVPAQNRAAYNWQIRSMKASQ